MKNNYLITIIMPTYQAHRTIELSLKSIREQNIDQNEVEILIIDGGSTDMTLEIASQYDVRIIENKRKLPEIAKQIGLTEARGKYGIFIDSDESFTNSNSLKRRIECFEKYPQVKNIVSTGQVCDTRANGVTRYANFIGDPFSNFVYRYNGYNRIEDLTNQYHYKNIDNGILLDFRNSEFLPLFDALGNTFEIEMARRLYEEGGKDKNFAANIFSNMVQKTECAIAMRDDFICHRSGLNRDTYLNKLKWRVKNNLFQTEGVGFAQRSKKENGLKKRKLLFVPYCALIIPCLADSARFAIKNKDLYFINHFLYTEYTFLSIIWYVWLKIIKYPVKIDKGYGKS
jgi:glycosyltransferase involved in cell wall biosynthesis